MNNAIPGFLAPPTPNCEHIITANADGSINGIIHRGEASEFQVVLETREGCPLFVDPTGETIFKHRDEYRFITTASQLSLPVGTSYLQVLVDRQPKQFFVMMDSAVFQTNPIVPIPCPSGISQSGMLNLAQGVRQLTVTFPYEFVKLPVTIVPVVYPDASAIPPFILNAAVLNFDTRQFEVLLSATTNSSGYRLAWAAWI